MANECIWDVSLSIRDPRWIEKPANSGEPQKDFRGDKMVKAVRVTTTAMVLLLLGWTVPVLANQDKQDKPKEQEKQQKQEKPAERQNQRDSPAGQDQKQATHQQDQQQRSKGREDAQRQKQQDNSNNKQEQQIARQQQDHQRQAQQNKQDNSARQQQQQARAQRDQQQQRRQRQDNSPNRQVQTRGGQDQQQQRGRQQQDNRTAQQRTPAYVRQQQVSWQGDRANSWQTEHRTWQQRGGYNGYRVPDDRFRSYYGQDHGFRIYTLPVRYVGGHRRFHYGGYWFGLIDPWPEYWSNDWYDNDDMYVDYYGDGYYLYNRRHPGDRIAISFYLR
jgi:chemotaxis protein histidine kinase CheA